MDLSINLLRNDRIIRIMYYAKPEEISKVAHNHNVNRYMNKHLTVIILVYLDSLKQGSNESLDFCNRS